MKVATPLQMNQIDSVAINRIGIPGMVLMENAALRVVHEVVSSLGCVSGKHISIFAGKGNNGGDAFACARHLYNMGAVLDVYAVCEKSGISGDAKANLDILDHIGINVNELTRSDQLETAAVSLNKTDLVVDGILGTGIKGAVKGLIKEILQKINSSGKMVLSIDIPSGVNGETGEIMGTCIKADKTVTFGLPKAGLLIHPGCEFTGELITADIGIPSGVIDSINIKVNTIDRDFVSKLIPARFNDSNKGNYGKVFILSGSVGMTGAGCLTASAALRTGSGLVYLGVPSTLVHIYDSIITESITIPLKDSGTGYLSKNCMPEILEKWNGMSVAAVGPGLTTKGEMADLISGILSEAEIPLILDADALNVIAQDISVLNKLKVPAVITPHPGEMARLCGITIPEVQNNRIEAAREFASKWNVTVVLKGSRTIVAFPDNTVYINLTGNPGMATGGSGDVLTGIIAGLAAQGLTVESASVCGVYIHGAAGDLAAEDKGEHGIIAGDLVNTLPYVIKNLIVK